MSTTAAVAACTAVASAVVRPDAPLAAAPRAFAPVTDAPEELADAVLLIHLLAQSLRPPTPA